MNHWRMFFRGRTGALKNRNPKVQVKPKRQPRVDDIGAYMPTAEEIAEECRKIRRAKGILEDE